MEVFRSYLVEERGLAESTGDIVCVCRRLFLDSRFVDEAADLGEVTTQGVTEFVLAETADRSVGYYQFVACGLRAFLTVRVRDRPDPNPAG